MNGADRLSELFMRFPGIGPKQAKRFVYFLLREHSQYKEQLIKALEDLKFTGKQCERCFRFYGDAHNTGKSLCDICSSTGRDKPTEIIRIRELTSLIHSLLVSNAIKEIIFALPVTDYGDNTQEYVQKTVKQIVGIDKVRLSHLARGLSSGLEIEYVDKDTFTSALERRN